MTKSTKLKGLTWKTSGDSFWLLSSLRVDCNELTISSSVEFELDFTSGKKKKKKKKKEKLFIINQNYNSYFLKNSKRISRNIVRIIKNFS